MTYEKTAVPACEPVPPVPTRESSLKSCLKKGEIPVDLRRIKPPGGYHEDINSKWSDDAWFEKRYGDPDYYRRIKGI